MTSSIDAAARYLVSIQALVARLMAEGGTKHDLASYDIEQFEHSRIPLGGLVQQFHLNNLHFLWEKLRAEQRQKS